MMSGCSTKMPSPGTSAPSSSSSSAPSSSSTAPYPRSSGGGGASGGVLPVTSAITSRISCARMRLVNWQARWQLTKDRVVT